MPGSAYANGPPTNMRMSHAFDGAVPGYECGTSSTQHFIESMYTNASPHVPVVCIVVLLPAGPTPASAVAYPRPNMGGRIY